MDGDGETARGIEEVAPPPDAGGTDVAPSMVLTTDLPRGIAITTPQIGADGFEGALAVANQQARSGSLERLATWFPGYDFAAAAQNVDDRRYNLLAVNDELLEQLDAPATISRIVAHKEHFFGFHGVTFSRADRTGHQPPPSVVTRGVGSVSPGSGHFVVGGLADAIGDQWTTILNGIDRFDPGVAAVCDDLSRAYGARINTNAYLSLGRAEGFGPHWDTHDTIIVQVVGTKEWSVFEPSVLSAQIPWIDSSVSDRPIANGVLEPGMALVIPRGWGHQVHDSDELTIHYTIGINRLETHQLLDRLTWEAGYWPVLRADVPYAPNEDVRSYAGSVYDQPGGFGQTLSEITTDELIGRAIASFRARTTNRLFPDLLDTCRVVHENDWTGLALHMPVPNGVGLVAGGEQRPEVVEVGFNNVGVQLPRAAADAFVALASGDVIRPADLPPIELDDGDLVDPRVPFCRDLVRHGLAQVVPTAAGS